MMQKACEATQASQVSSKPIISFFLAFTFFAAAIWYQSHVNFADQRLPSILLYKAFKNAFISMVQNIVASSSSNLNKAD